LAWRRAGTKRPAGRLAAGLRQLEQLCVMELVDGGSGQVVARQVAEPDACQKQLVEGWG
jgi:hypothetical protein